MIHALVQIIELMFLLCISTLAVAGLFLGYGAIYDVKLYRHLKSKKKKAFMNVYSLNTRKPLLGRVWRYIYDNSDMNDAVVKKCKNNLRTSVYMSSLLMAASLVTFLAAYVLVFMAF